jgi:hypothetical protein
LGVGNLDSENTSKSTIKFHQTVGVYGGTKNENPASCVEQSSGPLRVSSREANGYVCKGSKFLEPRASGNRPSHSRQSNDEAGALFTRVLLQRERDGAEVASANDRDCVYACRRPQNRVKGVRIK